MSSRKKIKTNPTTPFNSIISQINKIDGKPIPCIIDYQGLSVYHCDTPLEPPKKPAFSLIYSSFEHWKRLVIMRSNRRYLDINNIYLVDLYRMEVCFTKWTKKYYQLKNSQLFLYFTKWCLHTKLKIDKRNFVTGFGQSFFRRWRIFTFISRTEKHHHMKALKDSFAKWQYQRRFNLTCQRIQKLRELPIQKRFFRLWKIRARNKQLKAKLMCFQESSQNIIVRPFMDKWIEKYLFRKRKIPRKKNILKRTFSTMVKAFDATKGDRDLREQVQKSHNKILLIKAIKKWKQRFVNKKSRRSRKVAQLWVLMVVRRYLYSEIKKKRELKVKAKVFYFMKGKLDISNLKKIKVYYKKWKAKFIIHSKYNRVYNNSCKMLCEHCMMRWRMLLRSRIDDQIVEEMRNEIVYRHLLQRTFRRWIQKAIKNDEVRNQKVKQFRKRILVSFPFMAWKNYTHLQAVRAIEHYKLTLERKCFMAMKGYKKLVHYERLEKAIHYDDFRLKRRFFKTVKMKLGYRSEEAHDEMVVKLLNRNRNFFGISKLSYI